MIARWDQGRASVERLLSSARLEPVAPNRPLTDLMLEQADAHLASAQTLAIPDPTGAFQLAYDAARKALAALLANQGLRPKGLGAHLALYEVARAQLHPPMGPVFEPFDWMRRLRNSTEYPDTDRPVAASADVDEAIPAARAIINAVRNVLDEMPPF